MSKSKAQSIPSTSFHKQATSDESELPEGWAVAPVGDILGLVNGCPFKPSHWKKSGLPIIRIQNLNNPNASFNYCTDEMPEKFRVRNGDLLFAWSGTPGTSFGAHVWDGGDAWLNQHIFRVEFNKHHFDRTFLKYSINRNLAEYIEQAHGGAGLAHITKGMFEKSLLPIAPLAEQCRIVAKLEEVFGEGVIEPAATGAHPRLAETLSPVRPRRRLLRKTHCGLEGRAFKRGPRIIVHARLRCSDNTEYMEMDYDPRDR